MALKIQNENIKSSSELVADGGTAAQLPNDTKVYVTANGLNKTLYQAVVDGDLAGGSSSAGSADTITVVDADNYTSLTAWSTGDGTIVQGSALPGGTLQGTFELITASPSEGTKHFRFTQAAGSLDSYLFSDAKTIDPIFRGKDVGVNIPTIYDGADNDILLIVRDVTNNRSLTPSDFYVKASTVYKNNQVVFSIPSNCLSIQLGMQIKVLNSGKIINFDMLSVQDRPFVMANVNDTQSLLLQQANNALTDRTGNIRYNLATATYKRNVNPNSLFVVEDYPTTSATRVRFLRECTVVVAFTANMPANANLSINHFNSANTNIQYFYADVRPGTGGSLSGNVNLRANVGDYITVEEPQGLGLTNNADTADLSVDAIAQNQSIITPAITNGAMLVCKSASQSIPDSVTTKITWDTVTYDPENLFVNATDRWVAPRDGVIQVSFTNHWDDGFSGTNSRWSYVFKNGIAAPGSYYVEDTNSGRLTQTRSLLVPVLRNDYIEIYARQNSTVSINIEVTGEFVNSFGVYYIDAKPLVATPVNRICYIKDVKSGTSSGGTPTASAYVTRTLNTLEGETSFVTLASNQFKPASGTYGIEASAPGYNTARHVTRLRNVTQGTTTLVGSSSYSETTSSATTHSFIIGTFIANGTDVYEIQHWVQSAGAGSEGFGTAQNSSGESFVFTCVKLTKIK